MFCSVLYVTFQLQGVFESTDEYIHPNPITTPTTLVLKGHSKKLENVIHRWTCPCVCHCFAFSVSAFEFLIQKQCRHSWETVPLYVFKSIVLALLNPINADPCIPVAKACILHMFTLVYSVHTTASCGHHSAYTSLFQCNVILYPWHSSLCDLTFIFWLL